MDHGAISQSLVGHWLMSCAECGMCEQACPKGVPLAAIMYRIGRQLKSEVAAI
jgi:Fe-S oxidoreductase